MRRILAGLILLGGAVGSAYLRADGAQFWIELAGGLFIAAAALVFLHYRWKSNEKRLPSAKKVKDIFS